jgi:hypothetical protein
MRLVITSVDYADFLSVTLPAWRALVPNVVIATAPWDLDTQAIAAEHGVSTIVTDAWRLMDVGHVGERVHFNMALGLDVAFGLFENQVEPPADGEVCGHVSADCYPVGRWPKDDTFKPDTIYGFWRYDCPTPSAFAAFCGDGDWQRFPQMKNGHGWPIGYCQLFRYRPGLRFGSFPTAGKFDIRFREKFTHKVMRDEVALIHLGPASVRENWAGRTIEKWVTA